MISDLVIAKNDSNFVGCAVIGAPFCSAAYWEQTISKLIKFKYIISIEINHYYNFNWNRNWKLE